MADLVCGAYRSYFLPIPAVLDQLLRLQRGIKEKKTYKNFANSNQNQNLFSLEKWFLGAWDITLKRNITHRVDRPLGGGGVGGHGLDYMQIPKGGQPGIVPSTAQMFHQLRTGWMWWSSTSPTSPCKNIIFSSTKITTNFKLTTNKQNHRI